MASLPRPFVALACATLLACGGAAPPDPGSGGGSAGGGSAGGGSAGGGSAGGGSAGGGSAGGGS
ncbi:MAG: hypothetical protein K1X89_24955, partial [Myxococcaceae bacterium]|nr:hypothetical protein [Myxococcaceae bacterium]